MTKKEIFLVIISIILFLAMFEAFLRIFYPQNVFVVMPEEASSRIFEKSNELPWMLRQNISERHRNIVGEWDVTIKTNSLGLRNDELQKDNKTRILVLGDSFTFGYGVENNETYVNLLERRFNNSIGFINAGYAGGYSTDTEYVYLKNHGLKLKPDIVMLGFFIGNDISDIMSNSHWIENEEIKNVSSNIYYIDESNRLRVKGLEKKWYYDANVYLSMKSHAYIFFKTKIRQVFQGMEPAEGTIYNEERNENMSIAINTTKDLLLKINKITNESNVGFVIILIPTREQVAGVKLVDKEGKKLDLEKINREFIGFFEDNGINYIDLMPYLRNEENIYFKTDPHWNKNGHEVVARAIYESLINVKETNCNYV